MIIIASNRNLNEAGKGETLFGESMNSRGPGELRFATAEFDTTRDEWAVDLLSEPDGENLKTETRPSKALFERMLGEVEAGHKGRNWVLYIHGYNQSFGECLRVSREIAERYEVEVMAFAWPANPGGFVLGEYSQARHAARASVQALDRAIGLLEEYVGGLPQERFRTSRTSINLLAHSLGNYLVENFVRDPIFCGQRRIFDNVVLHQPDVNHGSHTEWIDAIANARRVYVTINLHDAVLRASDLINPPRLGNTLRGLEGKQATYIDFTNGRNVETQHNFFWGEHDNAKITHFFKQVLQGQLGESEGIFEYDSRVNVFRLKG